MGSVAVIPAYNEANTVAEVVRRCLKYVDEVIVVDDGSHDNTAERAEKAGAKVVRLERNTGKANAVREGIRHARGYTEIFILDADLQHLPEEIPVLREKLKNHELVVGSRFIKKAEGMPLKNRISNRLVSILMSFLLKQKITDPQSGFRALKGECAEKLELKAERYALEHIMLLEAKKKGFRIAEAPISTVYGREKSYIHPIRDTLIVVYYILRFILRGS